MQVVVTPLVRQGLLEKHLKPWLYRGSCPTPRLGFSSIDMFRVVVLLFTVVFIVLFSVGL